MGAETKIEWCDATLNLWWGCTKVSDGCKHCYAEHLSDQRYHKGAWGPGGVRREVKSWRSTLNKISKRAKAEGRRLRVFCQSMSDTFEGAHTMGGFDSENWRLVSRLQDELLGEIVEHPELDFLLLTKRPENVLDVVHRHDSPDTGGWNWTWPSNLWLGTSVEDQKTADERIPELLAIPAAVRFLSCEPLLGQVNLFSSMTGELLHTSGNEFDPGRIDWVICGGESGPNARPMHPDWARSLRDQCQAAGVPFLFKQWGEWRPTPLHSHQDYGHVFDDWTKMYRAGKHSSGRLLDRQTWDEFPVGGS